MKPITVISVGPGSDELLTFEARHAIDRADVVFCASRHTVLIKPEQAAPLFPFEQAFERMQAARDDGQAVAVLVSGDAGIFSLMPRLAERFGRKALCVLPGVSALQAFSAALAVPWQDAAVISAHGRDLSPSALCHAARTHRQVFMFLDKEHDAAWIRASLDAGGLAHVTITLGDRLSYSDAYIGPIDEYTASTLCMAYLENDQPEAGLPPVGLPDEAFIRGKTPMTKQEIRTQILAALRLTSNAVIWDVGAGTGSVTVECARQCPMGHVYAIEQKEDAVTLIQQNVAHFHLLNVSVMAGHAPEALAGLPYPTHVFLGGTGRESDAILDDLEHFGKPIRVVATAVTLETVHALHQRFRQYADCTATQIAVSRLAPLGSYTMLQAQNPVFIFAATIGGAI